MTAFAGRISSRPSLWEVPVWIGATGVAAVAGAAAAKGGGLVMVGVAAAVLAVGYLFSTRRTGVALAIVLLYLGLLDGYLRLRSGHANLTLARDVLLYAVAGGVLVRAVVTGRRLELPPLSGWVLAFVVVVGVQVANPAAQSLGTSLAGIRPHLEFVPLFFLAYWTMRDARSLRVFLALLLTVGAANGVVGYVQSTLTPNQLASWGPGYRERVLGQQGFVGGGRAFYDKAGNVRVRPLGLGADAGFAGQLGVIALPAGLALFAIARRMRTRFLVASLLALTALGVFTSQTRAGVIASVVAVIGYAALASVSRRWWTGLAALAAGALLVLVLVSLVAPRTTVGSSNHYGSLTPSSVLKSTQKERPLSVVGDYFRKYPLGAGMGKAGPAAGRSKNKERLNSETEFSYLIAELGIPGLVTFLAFQLYLIGLAIRRSRRVPFAARPMTAAVAAPMLAMVPLWFVTATSATAPLSPYFWFAAGTFAFWFVRSPDQQAV
jgi:hypothetical protein